MTYSTSYAMSIDIYHRRIVKNYFQIRKIICDDQNLGCVGSGATLELEACSENKVIKL